MKLIEMKPDEIVAQCCTVHGYVSVNELKERKSQMVEKGEIEVMSIIQDVGGGSRG